MILEFVQMKHCLEKWKYDELPIEIKINLMRRITLHNLVDEFLNSKSHFIDL